MDQRLRQEIEAREIEACRRNAADAAIGAALRDVPVPDDLAERLLMALKAAEQGEPSHGAPLMRPQAADIGLADEGLGAEVEPAARRPRSDLAMPAATSRRVWLGLAVAAAAI